MPKLKDPVTESVHRPAFGTPRIRFSMPSRFRSKKKVAKKKKKKSIAESVFDSIRAARISALEADTHGLSSGQIEKQVDRALLLLKASKS